MQVHHFAFSEPDTELHIVLQMPDLSMENMLNNSWVLKEPASTE